MNLLKEWLVPTVECELRAALDWKQTISRLRDDEKYEDDGITLRVKVSNMTCGVVQITKLVNCQDPVVLCVSDSINHLNATIATSAAERFLTEFRRRVTENTLGGIIKILNFEILVTHKGPQDFQITLLIKEFQSIGSDGSGTFGKPRALVVCEAIQELQRELRAHGADASIRDQKQATKENSSTDSTLASQDDQFELSSDSGSQKTSQQALATQAPRSRIKNPELNSLLMQQDRNHISTVRQRPPSPELKNGNPTVKKKGKDTSSISSSPHPPAKALKASENVVKPKNSHALLQLLPPEKQTLALARSSSVIKSVSPTHLAVADSKAEENLVEPEKLTGHCDEPSINARNSLVLVDGRMGLPLEEPSSSALIEESLISGMKTQKADMAKTEIPCRITRRAVRILKDQERLLEESSSWIPAEPGRRIPVANLPIKTLQAISRSADSWAKRLLKLPEKVLNNIELLQSPQSLRNSDTESDCETESNSEVSVSLSEWPQSSPVDRLGDRRRQEQLPPDSSPEMPAYKLPEKKMRVRLSSSSPRRRTSADASREPESPSKSSPSLSSPSQISTRPTSDLKLYSEPAPPASHDGGLSSLAHSGQVTETDFSQTGEQHSCHGSRIAPSHSKTIEEDTLQSNSTSNSYVPSNQQLDSISSQRPNANQPNIDGHSASTTDMESSGPGSNSQASIVDAQIGEECSHLDYTPMQYVPSTAPQKEEPSLQVKRTPYFNGKVTNIASQGFNPYVSPSKRKPLPLENGICDTSSAQAPSWEPAVADASGFESQSTKPSEDLAIRSDEEDVGRRQSLVNLNENSVARQPQHRIDSQYQSGLTRSHLVEETRLVIEETILPGTAESRSALVIGEGTHSTSDRDDKVAKRKLSFPHVLSSNVTKRRRLLKSDRSMRTGQSDTCRNQEEFSKPLAKNDFIPSLNVEDAMQQTPKHSSLTHGSQAEDKGEGTVSQIRPERPDESATELSSASPSPKARQAGEGTQDSQSIHQVRDSEPADEVMIDAYTRDTRGKHSPKNEPRHLDGIVLPSPTANLFDRFRLSYLDYAGNIEHFTALCAKLRKLVDAGRGLHPALWDDFIIRHKIDYSKYLHDCTNRVEDPMPYDQFYQDEIDGARYINQVVTRKTLQEALALGATGQQRIEANFHVPADPEPNIKISRPLSSSHGSSRGSPQIIELPQKPTVKHPRRSLPWSASNTASSARSTKAGTPSTPIQMSYAPLSNVCSNQPSDSSHTSNQKPATSPDSPAKLSTANILQKSREAAHPVEGQRNRTVNDSSILDKSHRRMERNLAGNKSHALGDRQKDDDSPFSKFAKAYLAIESGNGNSYATSKNKSNTRESRSKARLRRLDCSTWQL